jgi:outer membrane immunogenic protein
LLTYRRRHGAGHLGGGPRVRRFAPNWTLRGEYLFAQFAADTAIGNLVNGSGTGPGCVAAFSCGATFTNSLSTLNVQIVRAGLNYKFDWGSPVPPGAFFFGKLKTVVTFHFMRADIRRRRSL